MVAGGFQQGERGRAKLCRLTRGGPEETVLASADTPSATRAQLGATSVDRCASPRIATHSLVSPGHSVPEHSPPNHIAGQPSHQPSQPAAAPPRTSQIALVFHRKAASVAAAAISRAVALGQVPVGKKI